MKRTCLGGLALLLIALALPATTSQGSGDDKDVKKKANIWMKAKLEFSRQILEGLTDGDFDKIDRNARALNFAGFFDALFRPKNPNYNHQILLFVHANDEIVRQAKEKNLLGATLAYNQLMVSCVQCHQMLRQDKK